MIRKGDILTQQQLDDAVHEFVVHALNIGMIPIAGIMSRRQPDGRHEVLGCGWNHLREGVPGIHGETGAIMNMGRIPGGYRDLVATSSLSPCPFCQCCLALHLGVMEIRILDATNYKPDFTGYAKVGLTPSVSEHPGIIKTFGQWVRDPANAVIWNRDIGVWDEPAPAPFEVESNPQRTSAIMNIAHQKAREAGQFSEAPIGAAIVDHFGEIIGSGHPRIIANNDPSAVAAMMAWRACGARDHWKDKTLFLTCGPDHIAYSMFHIFKFGQLILASDRVFAGQVDAVKKLGVPVRVMNDLTTDATFKSWLDANADGRREYLGMNA